MFIMYIKTKKVSNSLSCFSSIIDKKYRTLKGSYFIVHYLVLTPTPGWGNFCRDLNSAPPHRAIPLEYGIKFNKYIEYPRGLVQFYIIGIQ